MIMEHKYFRRKEAKRIIIYHRTKRNEKMLDDGILSLKKSPTVWKWNVTRTIIGHMV